MPSQEMDAKRRRLDIRDSIEKNHEAVLVDNLTESLTFQQLDLDYYEKKSLYSKFLVVKPIVRLFGTTVDGHSVMCHVHNFYSFFYIAVPSPNFTQDMCFEFKNKLNSAITREICNNKSSLSYSDMNTYLDFYPLLVINIINRIELVQKENIYRFKGNAKEPFLKLFVSVPTLIPLIKRLLEMGRLNLGPIFPTNKSYATFESNIDFEIKFMIETQMVGCAWIELPPGKYTIRSSNKNSRCQIEADVTWKNIQIHPPDKIWSKVAPFKILSFDIECAGRKGIFPEPDKDPIIQIANVVQLQDCTNEPYIRNVFTLNSCAPINGCIIKSFESESDMLIAWSQFVQQLNPDIITGYNIQNFDFPYLLDRAKCLELKTFPYLGRMKYISTTVKNAVQSQSKQLGRRQNKKINLEGRLLFDLLQILLRDYKLRSYTLNSVSFHFLGEQKEDVHHSIITDLQNESDQTRRRLALYCLKDALLPLRLMDKLMSFINYMEMARVTGVPISYLLTRGQQIKVLSQLLAKTKIQNLILPAVRIQNESEYEGATVIEPCRGYYNTPIVTLDFSSLYPSIMVAHNLCYTTLIPSQDIGLYNLDDNSYIKSPSSDYFVKQNIRKGILTEILENLLAARKRAKNELKMETDPFRRKVLDGRQLALKISANSVYGFTGAQLGKLPCLAISQSVTSFGRAMIEQTKELVEAKFNRNQGYDFNAKVIYGDTDSILTECGEQSMVNAMEFGRRAADYVTSHFIKPIKLEFEKVYYPYLLISKKRYAGVLYTRPDKHDKMDCKGIETVRRDNCLLVSNLINNCLHKILIDRDPDGALELAKNTISDLLCNKIDISQLVITKELTKPSSEYVAKQAHTELARKMEKRNPGNSPKLGDRVPYVIIESDKKLPLYKKSEDPIYVLENDIPINSAYYLHNQLSKPLLRIFEPILGVKAKKILLEGDHMLKKAIVMSKIGPLAKFTKKLNTCVGCHCPNGTALCKYCKLNEKEIYLNEMSKLNVLEEKFWMLWMECQRCQKSFHQPVLCSNNDCPIFYMRLKARKDLTNQEEIVQRFSNLDW